MSFHLRAQPATTPATAAEPVEFPTFGVAAIPPAASSWVELPPGMPSRVVQWAKVDAETRKPRAFLSIDVEEAGGRSVKRFADELARKVNGIASAKPPVAVGGSPAVRVHAAAPAPGVTGPQPAEAIVVEHGGWVYSLALARVPGEGGQPELEALAKGLRWIELQPPATCLDSKTVRSLFQGRIDVTVPEAMRPLPADETPVRVHLSIANLMAKRTEYFAMVQLLAKKEDVPIEQMAQALIDGANQKTKKEGTWTWQPRRGGRAGGPVRMVTEALEVEHMEGITDAAGGRRPWMQWGLVMLDERRVVLVHFTILAGAEDRAAYEKLGGQIVDSVRPGSGAVRLR